MGVLCYMPQCHIFLQSPWGWRHRSKTLGLRGNARWSRKRCALPSSKEFKARFLISTRDWGTEEKHTDICHSGRWKWTMEAILPLVKVQWSESVGFLGEPSCTEKERVDAHSCSNGVETEEACGVWEQPQSALFEDICMDLTWYQLPPGDLRGQKSPCRVPGEVSNKCQASVTHSNFISVARMTIRMTWHGQHRRWETLKSLKAWWHTCQVEKMLECEHKVGSGSTAFQGKALSGSVTANCSRALKCSVYTSGVPS